MIGRRDVLKGAAALAAGLGAPRRAAAQTRPIRIGFVSPQTGALAPFGEADRFTIGRMNVVFGEGLAMSGSGGGAAKVPIQIVQKDSQSSPNRAGEVANDLILKDKVDLVLVSSTPETANPVCDACELNEVPCISTVVPWQPWFFGRNGDPQKGFDWTYHFFWGLEDVIANF
ncbi:MAG: ABC transporter substrate-binding protein, partial [Myxococcales bacterium]